MGSSVQERSRGQGLQLPWIGLIAHSPAVHTKSLKSHLDDATPLVRQRVHTYALLFTFSKQSKQAKTKTRHSSIIDPQTAALSDTSVVVVPLSPPPTHIQVMCVLATQVQTTGAPS